ncbi:MAG: type II secretion system F family protein [Verrucomicrobia bacterium]|nr:type II secretion system F family protein [Verrucomicrobiota bacterium]
MDELISQSGLVFVPLLFALCFGGLAYSLFRALREGMESYDQVYAVDAARQFEDIFLFVPAKRIADIARIAAVTMFIIFFLLFGDFGTPSGLLSGLIFGFIAALAAVNSPRMVLRVLKQRRLERFNRQLVDALISMSNSLRAGFSILQAFEVIVDENQRPIAEEFGVFLQQVRIGVRVEDALGDLEERVGSEDLTLMVSAIQTARQTGGNLTEVFDKIAATIRERIRIHGRIRSLTAQGRLQGLVVGAMPLLLLFAMTALDPVMMRQFVGSTTGVALLILVGLLELIGFLIIRKMVNIEV